MVSMSIFAVITGFVLVNFRLGSRQDELRLGAENAATVIRDAVARAAAGTKVDLCVAAVTTIKPENEACPPGSVLNPQVPEGWGVVFGTADPGHIRLFADINGDHAASSNEIVSIENFSQSGLVQITNAAPAAAETSIVAVPGTMVFYVNNNSGVTDASLTLEHKGGGGQRTVRFNSIAARVEVTSP